MKPITAKQIIELVLLYAVIMLDGLATLALGLLSVAGVFAAFLFLVFNIGGALVGFENNSLICKGLSQKNQTRLEIVGFPVAPYACKPNGGLLQPSLRDSLKWLNEVPK